MAYEKDPLSLVPMVFGSMMHALNKFITPENWKEFSSEVFQWATNTVMVLYERDVADAPPPPVKVISQAQAKRFFAIAHKQGKWKDEQIKKLLEKRLIIMYPEIWTTQ